MQGNFKMRVTFLLLTAVLLSACVTPTKAIKPLDPTKLGTINVQTVSVSYNSLNAESLVGKDQERQAEASKAQDSSLIKYKPLKTALKEIATNRLETRDSDSNSYANVDIEIDNLKLANAAAAILIGDTDQLSGTVRVTDTKSKELFTEFYVDIIEGAGGLLGMAIRGAGVRERLSLQFADHIGDELGFEKVKTTYEKTEHEAE